MEDLLDINHLNFSTADAAPMSDLFTSKPNFTPYTAIIPGDLCTSPVDPNLVPACQSSTAKITPPVHELHNATWWAQKTKGLDFSDADRIDSDAFNHILWQGIMGDDVPYPTIRSGLDLRQNRAQLLKHWQENKSQQTAASIPGGQ
jgi:DNA-binding beta-propeller fold protein YncE